MSIKYFTAEESPNGHAGYRVQVRVDGKLYSKFFKSQASDLLAKQEAMRTESEWKHAARLAKSARALVPRYKGNNNVIVKNFRAVLYFCSRKSLKASGGDLHYCFPEFSITYSLPSGTQKQVRFRIDKLGFDEAFRKAVELYSEVFNLSDSQIAELWHRKPTRALFSGVLYDELVQRRGQHFELPSRKDVEAMLK